MFWENQDRRSSSHEKLERRLGILTHLSVEVLQRVPTSPEFTHTGPGYITFEDRKELENLIAQARQPESPETTKAVKGVVHFLEERKWLPGEIDRCRKELKATLH